MNSTSLSLLVRLRHTGGDAAWARFTQLYVPLLYFWARRVGLPASEADDLVQDVLLLLLDKIRSFEYRGAGSFRAWLRIVAINKARERFRKSAPAALARGDESLSDLAAAAESDPFWEAEYRQHLVARALSLMQSEFEPATWQACWQRIVEDRPAKEVAASLGLSEGAVYVYTGRVLRRLREELGDLID
jgi:RNA polymerase sigma-70 factor (ECF subfamily)